MKLPVSANIVNLFRLTTKTEVFVRNFYFDFRFITTGTVQDHLNRINSLQVTPTRIENNYKFMEFTENNLSKPCTRVPHAIPCD